MDETVAVRARHLIVDLGHDVARALGGRQSRVHTNAKTAKPMRVRRRNFNQCDVERHGATFKKLFDLAEIDRRVVGATLVDRLTHVAADKYGIVTEMAGHLGS